MRRLDLAAIALLVIGGLNWGLVGTTSFDLVATTLGPMSPLSRIVYALVGLAAVYHLVQWTSIRRQSVRLAAMVVGAVAISACDDDATSPSATALVRVVHASPDAPNVDVLVDGNAVLTNVPFKAASDYLAVPTGNRNLRVRAAGTSTVVIDEDASVTAGNAYTVLATGRVSSLAPLVLEDNLTSPGAGNIKLRLVHASPTAGNVDIYVTAPSANIATASPTLANVPFRAASNYLEVPAGTYRVRVTPTGSKTVAIDVNNVSLAAGQIRTAVAVDAPGGGTPLDAVLLADRN